MLGDPDIPAGAIAPHAAKLLRRIAEARKIRRFHQAALARLLKHEEPSQVNRWWNGSRRIGDENRDRLIAVFPDFADEIDDAIRNDNRLRKTRRGASAEPVAEGELADFTPAERSDLARLGEALRALDWPVDRVLGYLDSLADRGRSSSEGPRAESA